MLGRFISPLYEGISTDIVLMTKLSRCFLLEIFHSIGSFWHITIYTSSFFFLYSMRTNESNEQQEPAYELTRQDSLPRTE